MTCGNISKELADIRLQNVSLIRIIKYAFKNDNCTKSFIDRFIYPKRGIYKIAESLSNGLEVNLNSEVTGLIYSDNRIYKVIVNNLKEFTCNNLISTMPITELVRLFNPPDVIKRAVGNLKYRSLILVFIVLKRKKFTDNHWIYFPDGQIFGRLHESKNWSSAMAPAEKTGICLEIFCNKEDDVWKMADSEISRQVIHNLPLQDKFEIEEYFVERVGYAYPVYDLNYKDNLNIIKDYLSRYKNIFLLGRTGSFQYINMDTCIKNGLNLAYSLKNMHPKT